MKTGIRLQPAVLRTLGLPEPEYEYKFYAKRQWRFDVAFPEHKVALEFEGGVWKQGRHQRPRGFMLDMDKYNEAALMGWIVLRVATHEFINGNADVYKLLERAIKGETP